jgi:hypothetical protein
MEDTADLQITASVSFFLLFFACVVPVSGLVSRERTRLPFERIGWLELDI